MQNTNCEDITLVMNDYLSKLNIILPKIYGRQPTACVNTYGCQ